MIIATNTIRIKSGHVQSVAERFMNPKGVQNAPGFIRMELLSTQGEEHDELKVNTTWESRTHFQDWVDSDAFKAAHGQHRSSANSSEGPSPERPASAGGPNGAGGIMLGAKLSIHEVLFTYPT